MRLCSGLLAPLGPLGRGEVRVRWPDVATARCAPTTMTGSAAVSASVYVLLFAVVVAPHPCCPGFLVGALRVLLLVVIYSYVYSVLYVCTEYLFSGPVWSSFPVPTVGQCQYWFGGLTVRVPWQT